MERRLLRGIINPACLTLGFRASGLPGKAWLSGRLAACQDRGRCFACPQFRYLAGAVRKSRGRATKTGDGTGGSSTKSAHIADE